MPIKFACPQCKNVMTVDSKFAGKKGKCNKCGSVVEVPAESPDGGASAAGGASGASAASGGQAGQPRQGQPRPQPNPGQPTAAQPGSGQAAGSGPIPGSPQSYNAAPPPSAAGIKGVGPLGHVFDELTESDYNRSSPYQNVYAPPKQSNDALNPMLQHAAKQELKASGAGPAVLGADGRPKLTLTIIVFAVLDILESLLLFGLTIALAVVGATLIDDEMMSRIPLLGAGIAIFIVILGFWATTLMASGLGLLTKQVWGYCTALFVYSFQLGFRIIVAISAITDMERVVGPIIGVLFMGSITAYLFQEECRRVYGISRKSKLPLIVGGIGMGLSLGMGGLLFLLGVFASAVAGDQPLPP